LPTKGGIKVQNKKCTTKEDVLEIVKERGVKFIRSQFTDILGIIKSWAIPVEQLEEAFENGVMFDGSSIQGFTSIEESDMKLVLYPSTFRILPWRPTAGAVARILGDVYLPDGKPFQGDPRYVLKTTIEEAQKLGFSMQVGPEMPARKKSAIFGFKRLVVIPCRYINHLPSDV
jgi:glutamine synthetase